MTEKNKEKKKVNIRKIAYLAVVTAAGLILHLVENLLPPLLVFAPGTKVGLANAATLFALVVYGWREGLVVLVIRCVLGSLFAGNMGMGLVYSLSGGFAAYCVMALLYNLVFPRVSLPALSVAGACVHNIVQLFIASLTVGQARIFYLLPFHIVASFAAGFFIGFTVYFLVRYLPKSAITAV